MCNRGDWRGFHTRHLETPKGKESPLVVMEQCTSCGDYRAKNIEGCAYVPQDQKERRDSGPDMPDPESDDGGSVWGPDTTTESGDSDSW